jgi:raffinose/stachyose/melibiose transport system permease protein
MSAGLIARSYGRGSRFTTYVLLVLLTIVALGPTAWVMVASLETKTQINSGDSLIPDPLTLQGYKDVFTQIQLQDYVFNTLLYASLATLGSLFVGLLSAYPSVRMRFPLRLSMTSLFSLALAIPIVGLLVPEYYVLLKLGLYDTRLGLVLFYIALFFPLAFVILRAYLLRIPVETEEAALVDGAGYLTLLRRIVLPLARPALATVAVVVFISVWNEFLFALVLAPSPSNTNVQVALSTFKSAFQFNTTGMLAGTTLVMLVPILAFLLLQRHVVHGLTAGASK